MVNLNPQTEDEQAVYNAAHVLLRSRDELSLSQDQFSAICRQSPDYTRKIILHWRISLLHATGPRRADIANIVRTVEWELNGPSEYIEYHHIDTEDGPFILGRMNSHPHEFSDDDLYALTRYYKRTEHPLNKAAVALLENRVVTLADRILAEPPKLSDDLVSLKESIRNYGFNPDLNAALQKIDQELEQVADAFDQAATMKHIRSFFEELHESIAKELQVKKPKTVDGTNLGQCGQAIDYLQRKGVITTKIKDLGRCLYAILSDGDYGVHALKANRDYTRLCRNMVVEYAVTLIFELNRRLAEPGDD